MRLFLFPISTKRTLLYCEKASKITTDNKTLIDKATARASATWVSWEKKDSGWQKKVTEYGNKALQRIPFEEWGLKSVPPLTARRKAEGASGARVDVVFPSLLVRPEDTVTILRRLATERQSLHRKRLWWSIIGMPISAPVALIPVIPNIPFFYLCFRAWSHWRALSGSKHLEFLLDSNLIQNAPSTTLDELYAAAISPTSDKWERARADLPAGRPADEEPNSESESVLLEPWNGRLIAKALDVPELQAELERASRQVQLSLKQNLTPETEAKSGGIVETKEKKEEAKL